MESQQNLSSTPLRTLILVLVAIAIIVATAFAGFYFGQQTNDSQAIPVPTAAPDTQPTQPDMGVACTMDAKLCPDGSAVGRVPPSCEFAPCPGESAN